MAKQITVEFYELLLKTSNKRQTKDKPPPPIEYVEVLSAFRLLESESGLIGKSYSYGNGDFHTSLEHVVVNDNKVNLVIGFYDKTAANRTVKNTTNGNETVQKRADYEAVKHFCHCVIKPTNNSLIAQIAIERVPGCPASRINKTLKSIFRSLEQKQPNSERIFQVTNPDGARNSDGTDDIQRFILSPTIHAMCSEYLEEAILNGRFKGLRLKGTKTNLDDPNNRLTSVSAELDFNVQPPRPDEEPSGFLQSIITAAFRNQYQLSDIKTFATIENEDTGKPQSIQLSTGDELNSAFVLRKEFDATIGRQRYSDNRQINEVFLSEIRRLFM